MATAALNLLPLPEFNPDSEVGSSVSKRWETWLKEFSMYVVANGITDDTRKCALLLYMAGSRVREIFDTLTDTGADDAFGTAKTKLTEYFKPQENKRYEIYKFRQLQQEDGESLDKFHTRLRTVSTICSFTDVGLEIEQQIIVGGKSSAIRKKALRDPNYKLKDMLVDGRGKESSLYQSRDIEGNIKEEIVDKIITERNRIETKKSCFNCGGEFPHTTICPAKGKQCQICLRYNHLPAYCRRGRSHKSTSTRWRKNINEANRRDNSEAAMSKLSVKQNSDGASSDDEYLFLMKFDDISNEDNPTAK